MTIPESIAPGNYVLRHEIIALHSAGEPNGAQNYPQCINLEVSGSGSDKPEGVPGTELYTADDEGITFNIYQAMDSYPIPGPALYEGGDSGSDPSPKPPTPTSSNPAPQPTKTAAPEPTQPPPEGGNPPTTPEDPSPSSPIEIPEDMNSRDLLLVAQQIIERLLELQKQSVVAEL